MTNKQKDYTAAENDEGNEEDDEEEEGEEEEGDGDCRSSGSDYETAFEDLNDEIDLSDAFSSVATATYYETDDIINEDSVNEEDTDTNEESQSHTLIADARRGGLEPVTKRKVSKRQKQRKRSKFKVTYAEEFVNLGDLFDTTNDIETVFTDTSDAAESVKVSCRFPTLSELCLQTALRRRHRHKSGQKPNAANREGCDETASTNDGKAPLNKEDPDDTASTNIKDPDGKDPLNKENPDEKALPNRENPDETAPAGAVSSGSSKLVRSSYLPQGIKRIMSDWQANQAMLDKQLAFIQNFVLPSLCVEKVFHKHVISCFYDSKNAVMHFPVRSLWCAFPIPVNSSIFRYPTSRSISYLYIPTVREFTPEYERLLKDFGCRDELEKLFISSTHVFSALAMTVDLMLASTVSDRCRSGSPSSDTEAITSATLTALGRVKYALRSRFPQIVDTLFDRVTPYVMWARGNVGLATQMFQTLVSKETKDVYKAMYLSEIAVMHAMFRETEMATRFHRLAAEVALSNVASEQVIQEATEQTQVILAGLHSTGVLSIEKAHAALQCWSSAIHLATPQPATTLGAVDSLLGLHLAHLTKNQDGSQCWAEAERRLKSWVGANKYLLYYISMVMALVGREAESTSMFKEFRTSNNLVKLPGEVIAPFLKSGQRKNPWSPLVAMVRGQREPVEPLTVVWRTQLRPPRLTTERAIESDLCNPDLNLRVSESGHLTGDMQMLMPPIREVLLDLHTGSVVLNNVPSFTGAWSGARLHNHEKVTGGFMLPTPCQIYRHDDSTTVHLMSPTLGQCHRQWHNAEDFLPTCPMMLTWKGPQGQTAKLNLVTIVKMAQKKELEALETVNDIPRYYGVTEESFRLIKASIDIAYNKNLSLEVKDLFNAVYSFKYRHRNTLKKAERRKQHQLSGEHRGPNFTEEAQTRALLHKDLRLGPRKSFKLSLDGEPLQFGQSLVVKLLCKRTKIRYHLFVDCRSREGFLNCRLLQNLHENQTVNKRQRGTNACQDNLYCFRSDNELLVYNGKGEREAAVNIAELEGKNHPNSNIHPCIIGEYVYGCTRDRKSIWRYHIYTEPVLQAFNSIWTNSLVPYWLIQGQDSLIVKVCALGSEVMGRGRFLFVHLTIGLALMDPDTMELLPIAVPENCPLSQSNDGKVIKVEFPKCKVLAEKSHVEDDTVVYRFVIGAQNKLFLFSVCHKVGSGTLQAWLLHHTFLPGLVKEACIVGKDGVLVSLTQHQDNDDNYREHVFLLGNNGHLHGVLLCLGRGPHSFCPVYMGANTDHGLKPGWYVYMRDGHDGIMCVKLFK